MRHFIHWMTALVLFSSVSISVQGQEPRTDGQAAMPLEKVLKADGTLDLGKGFSGSLDPKGWRMVNGKNGEPRFVSEESSTIYSVPPQISSVAGDEKWDDRFGFPIPGVDGLVYSIAVSGNDVYVGGTFTQAGGVIANNIAKWNGSTWSSLESGVNYGVNAIAVSASDVYVGGYFTQAGGINARGIAKWNGSSWSSLGTGVNGGTVYAIAVGGSDVYVGGDFKQAGDVSIKVIAKWNGSAWSSLGMEVVDGVAYAITVSGSDVYVGGGGWLNYIAKWNGSTWTSISNPLNGSIGAIAVNGSDVYVGGRGGVDDQFIAKWNGSTWSSLGSGVDGRVRAIAVSGNDIYVGGDFTLAGGVSANGIAKWNGSTWSCMGSGVIGSIYAIAVCGSDVYGGGDFIQAGVVNASCITKWHGSNWCALGNSGSGVNKSVHAIEIDGSDVYIGGAFTKAGSIGDNGVAKWDDAFWSSLGGGVSGGGYYPWIRAIAVNGSDVYVGGAFTQAGGVSAQNIAKWNGSAWSSMGDGVNGTVYDISVSGSEVYVAGNFTQAGGVSANRIAKWNGSSWSYLGDGLNARVRAVAVNGSDVYVGGDFSKAGGVNILGLAKWNGSAWSSLGSGVNSSVYAIAVSGSDLYVGGDFSQAGGIAAYHIAKWDGSGWSSLGSGVDAAVYAITIYGNCIYVGGAFSQAGDDGANHIAKWNGSAWSSLGSGVNKIVNAISINGNDVYVGGDFTQAGGKSSSYIACWHEPNQIPPAAPQNLTAIPGNGQVMLKWNKNTEGDFSRYRIYGGTSANPTVKVDSTTGGNTDTTKIITGLANGTTYYFRITAVDLFLNESGFSNEVHVTPTIVPDSLVAYYPFNGNADDESGNGHHGAVFGPALAPDRFGNADKAYNFDGDNLNRIVVDPFALPSTGTISVWFKPFDDGPTGWQNSGILSSNTKYVNHDAVTLFHYTGKVIAIFYNNAGNAVQIESNDPIAINQWHHLVCVLDEQKNIKLYLDGKLQNQSAQWTGSYVGQTPTVIGNFNQDDDNFDGVLDDLRIYNRPLSEGEIKVLYDEGTSVTAGYSFSQAGWYMVSLPVIPADSSVATLFPTALGGMAFGWDPDVGSYVPETKMKPKKGYWIAIPGSTTATVTGLPLDSYTEHFAVQGWYMIGSVIGMVNFVDPNDNPNGSVLSPAFGWNSSAGGYEPTTTLNEKEAYWIAAFGACDLTVGGAGGGAIAPMAKADWEAFYRKNGKTPPSPPTLDGKTSKAIETPKEFGLFQNYPNPFNPETTIRYQIPDAGLVRLAVYNTMGQAVRILVDGNQSRGSYEVVWDGKDKNGLSLGSGMYLVRMEAGSYTSMCKVLLMK